MDEQRREKDQQKKKKKKKKREREEAFPPYSHRQQIAALSSYADANQKQKEKKPRKLLCLQASTGEKILVQGKWKARHSPPKAEELDDQLCEEGNQHKGTDNEAEEEEEEEKKKKNKGRAHKHLEEENLHKEIEKGQQKKEKRQDGSRHSVLKEYDQEEKRRNKKKKREDEEEEEETADASLPHSQQKLTPFSCGDYAAVKQKGKETKARKMLQSYAQEVFSEDNAPLEAKKQSKKARSFLESVRNKPESDEAQELLSNKIGGNKEPLANHTSKQLTAMVINSSFDRDSPQEEYNTKMETGKKKETVPFLGQSIEANRKHVRYALNGGSLPSNGNSKKQVEEIWGVRFTPKEDEILKDAVWEYIKVQGWDKQEGLSKIFNLVKHKEARSCWSDIKKALPHRSLLSVRHRARLLLEKAAQSGKWSKEEENLLKRLQAQYGRKWQKISCLLDKHHISIKEKWRSLKLPKPRGGWTEGELQQLSDMVHKCIRIRALLGLANEKPNHHNHRDRISWDKIAVEIGTHSHSTCCNKWYHEMRSSLVADGHWADEDDFLLLKSLLESGACGEEEVEWGTLLDHRAGQICLLRWKQMVKHLGENRTRQFLYKLDILARRYAPELLDTVVQDRSITRENPPINAQV